MKNSDVQLGSKLLINIDLVYFLEDLETFLNFPEDGVFSI